MPPAPRIRVPLAWLAALLIGCGGPPASPPPPQPPPPTPVTRAPLADDVIDPRVLRPLLDVAFDPDGPALLGVDRVVKQADISPDGLRVVTASDQVATLWDGVTGQIIALLVGDPAAVPDNIFPAVPSVVRFSASGRLLARGTGDGRHRPAGIDLWDGRTGVPLRVMQGPMTQVLDLAFDAAEQALVSAHVDGIRRWDVATGAPLPGPPALRRPAIRARLSPFGASVWLDPADGAAPSQLRRTVDGAVRVEGGCSTRYAHFSTDGALTLCRRANPGARLRDATTGAELAVEPDGALHCPLPAADYRALLPRAPGGLVGGRPDASTDPLTCFDDERLRPIDARSGRLLDDPQGLWAFDAFAPAAQRVVVRSVNPRRVWIRSTRHARPWRRAGLPGGPTDAALGPVAAGADGRFAAALDQGRGAYAVAAWHADGSLIGQWPLADDPGPDLQLSTDGRRLLTGRGDVIDLDAGRLIPRQGPPPSEGARFAFMPDGRTVVSLGRDAAWWGPDGAVARTAPIGAFGPSARYARNQPIAAAATDGVALVDTARGQALRTLVERTANVACEVGALSDGGERLVARCGNSAPWQLIDLTTDRVLRALPDLSSRTVFRFSADGRRLLTADTGVQLREVYTGVAVVAQDSAERVAAVSPDGEWVAIGRASGHVEIFRVDPRPAWLDMPVFPGPVRAVAFSADGRHLIIAGEALPYLVTLPFPLTRGMLRAVACENRRGWPTPGFDCEGG